MSGDIPSGPQTYRVLARKYRPRTFEELIGQDAMVRTLANAFATDRLAHAFLFTGVRGVGKTSTARLLAKAFNCIGPDGNGGPTIAACNQCGPCRAIAQDRCIDVLEMDAASRTGVDDVREIIEGCRVAAAEVRTKVYIIDEVHMLSKAAFNALLKTLEEPPPHVKFIFATTEIRKVPLTVLSRCQRFDLRRVPMATLIDHFSKILATEKSSADAEALTLIARAADGSIRDGLSLLDQAIAHAPQGITADTVRAMIGLADRAQTLDLMAAIVAGNAPAALTIIDTLYNAGGDPAVVARDLLDLIHTATRLTLGAADEATLPESERTALRPLLERLSLSALHRLWQLLLKGLDEINRAPTPIQALEMAILRLLHAASLPDPDDILRRLAEMEASGDTGPSVPMLPSQRPAVQALAPPANDAPRHPGVHFPDFPTLVAYIEQAGEGLLNKALRDDVELIDLKPGLLRLRPLPRAKADIPKQLAALLTDWTGLKWQVVFEDAPASTSLLAQEEARKATIFGQAQAHPLVVAALAALPEARLIRVQDRMEDLDIPAPAGGAENRAPLRLMSN